MVNATLNREASNKCYKIPENESSYKTLLCMSVYKTFVPTSQKNSISPLQRTIVTAARQNTCPLFLWIIKNINALCGCNAQPLGVTSEGVFGFYWTSNGVVICVICTHCLSSRDPTYNVVLRSLCSWPSTWYSKSDRRSWPCMTLLKRISLYEGGEHFVASSWE